MAFRIDILTTATDARADVCLQQLQALAPVQNLTFLDVYTVDKVTSAANQKTAATALAHPMTQKWFLTTEKGADGKLLPSLPSFTHALEVGFRPGVTDNVGTTTREILENKIGAPFEGEEAVYSSRVFLLDGKLTKAQQAAVANQLANPLIQRSTWKTAEGFTEDGGMGLIIPKVTLQGATTATTVDLANATDEELATIGKKGIADADGTRRGPLGLGLVEMQAIRDYFVKEGRPAFDIEIETLAQTWSEHCKHTIFASAMDEDVPKGVYKTFIKGATEKVRADKGKNDFCVSVFKDNAGGIVFDEEWLVTDKVETHNTPSALDPFGGAITGIVGVNRDCLGFGQGAKPVLNRYGFCLADPRVEAPLYRAKGKKNPMLSASAIAHGVIAGVEAGGNQSGIPTPQGFLYYDARYRGKPLVFAGTVGLVPRSLKTQEGGTRDGADKKANPGDRIIMAGGKVGKDGIHGATFSSEALDEGSPVTAVQIGDPITQKKLSDAVVKEIRALGLYTSITDNGAGGLSSSVGEMAEQSGGFIIDLDKVPLKYPGLSPWETWISESQERMTMAVPPENVEALLALFEKRGVQAWDIGEFTKEERAVVMAGGKKIMDMTMDFLHDGLPKKTLKTTFTPSEHPEPELESAPDIAALMTTMLARPNVASWANVSTQYDYNVQGSAVLGPLQGVGYVSAEAAVSRPVLKSPKGVVTSHGLAPRYSDIHTYHMASCAIDTAVRNAIAIGAPLDHLALLDNFCWCSSDEPERLGQLKQATKACYDVAVAYGTPWISGKDSMFNDFKGYDADGEAADISIPPTLLVSGIGVMADHTKAVSLDVKMAGDKVYVLGLTKDELGGSEYFDELGFVGNTVPQVDIGTAKKRYQAYHQAIKKGLVASSLPVHFGGLGTALAKTAIAGHLGLSIDLNAISTTAPLPLDKLLFSESQSRLLVTVAPENERAFETIFAEQAIACIGNVTEEKSLKLMQGTDSVATLALENLEKAYKGTWENL